MNETMRPQPFRQKATILRERVIFAAFISILFALAFNGAVFLIDQGISILSGSRGWGETLIAAILLLAGVFVIAITGLLVVSALQTLRLAWMMEKDGQVTSGKVLQKVTLGEGKNRSCRIIYAFKEDIHFEERVSEAGYQNLNVDDLVRIRFLAGHPDIARLEH